MSLQTEPFAGAARPRCDVRDLGQVPYGEAAQLQEELVRKRAANEIPDQLLLLEHPHVLTLGRNSKTGHILADRQRLSQMQVELCEAGRGGDVTYHGPGQLVVYPILDLRPDRCDLHRYVRDLEDVLLRLLAEYRLDAYVVPGRTGVWLRHAVKGEAKVGAIGVRVSKWVTSHGIALNVATDLRYFDLIVPCGIADRGVTSLQEVLKRPPSRLEVGRSFARHFAAVFQRRLVW